MLRRVLLLTSVAMMMALAGCHHKCGKLFHKDGCCPTSSSAPPSGRNPILLPPTTLPTTPGAGATSPFPPPGMSPVPSVQPGPSGYPAPKGPDVLFPDPLPASPSARPTQPGGNFLSPPVKPQQTTEPPKATPNLPGYTKVKDGLFSGGKPTLDGFDSLKQARFRTVIYLHTSGADVAAVKDMASTRGLDFFAIETTPETLASASKEFDRVTTDKLNHPAYVFGDDYVRTGAVWYLHFRNVETLSDDVARLRAKSLGLSEQSEEGKAFALAIQRVLETR